MKRYIIAIDQSTSASKVMLVNNRGRILRRASAAHTQFREGAGFSEQDVQEIYQNVVSCIETVTDGVAAGEIAALAISNQRETTAFWHRATGLPARRDDHARRRKRTPVRRPYAPSPPAALQPRNIKLADLLNARLAGRQPQTIQNRRSLIAARIRIPVLLHRNRQPQRSKKRVRVKPAQNRPYKRPIPGIFLRA